MTYDDLGDQTRLPIVYVVAIKNNCRVCLARPGEFCQENGRDRKRPHGSRMVVSTGEFDASTETSSPSNQTATTNTSSREAETPTGRP